MITRPEAYRLLHQLALEYVNSYREMPAGRDAMLDDYEKWFRERRQEMFAEPTHEVD